MPATTLLGTTRNALPTAAEVYAHAFFCGRDPRSDAWTGLSAAWFIGDGYESPWPALTPWFGFATRPLKRSHGHVPWQTPAMQQIAPTKACAVAATCSAD